MLHYATADCLQLIQSCNFNFFSFQSSPGSSNNHHHYCTSDWWRLCQYCTIIISQSRMFHLSTTPATCFYASASSKADYWCCCQASCLPSSLMPVLLQQPLCWPPYCHTPLLFKMLKMPPVWRSVCMRPIMSFLCFTYFLKLFPWDQHPLSFIYNLTGCLSTAVSIKHALPLL